MKAIFAKRSSIVFLALSFISAAVFICNSLTNGELSTNESGFIVQFLANHIFKNLSGGDFVVLSIVVRKLAHFVEFAVFFAFFNSFMISFTDYKNKALIFFTIFIGVFAPLIDETVQYLSPGRTSMVYDIWIDFAGCLFGMLVSTVIYRIVRRKRAVEG